MSVERWQIEALRELARHAENETAGDVIAAVHDLRDKFRKQPLRRQAAWSSHEMAVLLDEILALGGEQ